MSIRLAFAAAIIVVLVFVGLSVPFIVYQTEQAIVLQFGDPIRVQDRPGLDFKLPYQSVITYDKRVLDFDLPAARVTAADQKPMIVDAYARFRIADPLLFYKTVGTETAARARMTPIMAGSVRNIISTVDLADVVSGKREITMQRIREQVNDQTKGFGIAITDVRLRRADLPEENSKAIYARMKSDREREAAQFRADGDRLAAEIKADVDRQRVEILAEAQKQAQILRGQGDAESIKVYADAFGRDKDFFAFYRSLEAYRNALGGNDTTFLLSPDSDFFRYFGAAPHGAAGAGGATPAPR
ncbi:MAG TPA: protease modulator HflC [Stellaceae bacterium]|nr:protease modulator HflC [Stellaceae bacterium]